MKTQHPSLIFLTSLILVKRRSGNVVKPHKMNLFSNSIVLLYLSYDDGIAVYS